MSTRTSMRKLMNSLLSTKGLITLCRATSSRLIGHLLCRFIIHKRLESRKVNPHAPTHPGSLQLSTTDVPPQRSVAESGVPLRFWIADPLLLHRLFQQGFLLFFSPCSVHCLQTLSQKCKL